MGRTNQRSNDKSNDNDEEREKYNKIDEMITLRLAAIIAKMENLQKEVDDLKRQNKEQKSTINTLKETCSELEKSLEFSNEMNKKHADHITEKNNEIKQQVETVDKKLYTMKNKTNDLEDRSRRDNILIWNIPEVEDGQRETDQDCEDKIVEELTKCYPEDAEIDNIRFERTHRLGRKKPGQNRAIIAKLSYHKDKQYLLSHSRYLRKSVNKVSINEDFCKETLVVRKQLWQSAKLAKENYEDATYKITHIKLSYMNVVLSYYNKSSGTYFTRTYTQRDTRTAGWYKI